MEIYSYIFFLSFFHFYKGERSLYLYSLMCVIVTVLLKYTRTSMAEHFGTMKICLRQGLFELMSVHHRGDFIYEYTQYTIFNMEKVKKKKKKRKSS